MSQLFAPQFPATDRGVEVADTELQRSEEQYRTIFNASIDAMVLRDAAFRIVDVNATYEALTGFSNAFLPYGSIPYQQYVRHDVPSLASFLGNQGYVTRAIHPFEGWFWNRENVYDAFGFDRFLSIEKLPPKTKRGSPLPA